MFLRLRFQCFYITDRHSHDTPEKQKEEERIFKDVGEAYAVLSDAKKRARYDSGADLEDEGHGGFGGMSIYSIEFGKTEMLLIL